MVYIRKSKKYKQVSIVILLFFIFFSIKAQSISLLGKPDSLFPVTNNFYEPLINYTSINREGSDIFKVLSHNSKYFLIGNFTHLSQNKGSALIFDTNNLTIKSDNRWRINGQVKTSLPDGLGGFYIGGTFTKIGDSVQKYIAHINQFGQPLPLNLTVNNVVNVLYVRNDTLFIGGQFTRINSLNRYCFAMFSLAGNALLPFGGNTQFAIYFQHINAFIIKKDTLLLAGYASNSYQSLRKYNFRNNLFINWQPPIIQYDEVNQIKFNNDSSIVLYTADSAPNLVRAIRYDSGQEKYKLLLSLYPSEHANNGSIADLCIIGDKAFVVGHFEYVTGSALYSRKGFVSFNASTGEISTDNININGYPVFIYVNKEKIFLSGHFSSVKNVNRENFAVLDTGNLTVTSMQLSPTDDVLSMCFSGTNMFIAGNFNGINSIRRNGVAVVDSATRTILPFSPVLPNILAGCKRAYIRGDTLFILGVIDIPNNCVVNDYSPQFLLYSISTGNRLATPNMNYDRMDDMIIDSNYLYASTDNLLRRFFLPSLTQDNSWIIYTNNTFTPIYMTASNEKIYVIGDNRFAGRCTYLPNRFGYLMVLPKTANPAPNSIKYNYNGLNPVYDFVTFDHSLLLGNKLFIQGSFNSLNGKTRRNFACINVSNGNITDWEPVFSGYNTEGYDFKLTSDLKFHHNKIWFGGWKYSQLSDGNNFSGFGAIDTFSGALSSPSIISLNQLFSTQVSDVYYKDIRVNDFIFDNNKLIVSGGYDSINSTSLSCIAAYNINYTASPLIYNFIGNGNWNNPNNWSANTIPPIPLPPGSEIIINPSGNGECILNVTQTISAGAKITVAAGKKLRLPTNLIFY